MGGVDLPEWRPLRRNAEPHVPLLPHRLRLVVRPQRGERQRAERRTIARQRDLTDRQLAFQRQQEGDLLAAAPTLAQPHPRSRQALDLILAHRTVLEQRAEPARAHLRVAPVEIARRPDVDDLAPADLLALTGMDIPAAGADERPQPRGLIGMDVARRLARLLFRTLIVVPAKAGTQHFTRVSGFRLFASLRPERRGGELAERRRRGEAGDAAFRARERFI